MKNIKNGFLHLYIFYVILFLLALCIIFVILCDEKEQTAITGAGLTIYYGDGTTESYTPTLGTIVIDPGHGGVDPGKVSNNGILEKNINLEISLQLKTLLESHGYEVVMTRETDEDICTGDYGKIEDLENRIDIIRDAQALFVISIHQNSFSDSSVKGAQVFYHQGSEEGEAIAKSIQESMRSLDETNQRQAKSNNDYYLFLHSATPIVIVECGFLTNPDEELLLTTAEYRQQVAESICEGIRAFLIRQ